MKSLFYPEFDTLEMRDIPIPGPGDSEVLVRIAACGICGSELETFKHRSDRRKPPLVMGHEFCGTIESEPTSDRWKNGDRVVSHAMTTCDTCFACRRGEDHLCQHRKIFGMHRQGAFAEYVVVPESALFSWPDGVSASSACLAEPLANGVHVINRVSRLLNPEKVVIIGAGPIGLMCLLAFRKMTDAPVWVIEPRQGRRTTAEYLGAVKAIGTDDSSVAAMLREASDGEGMDVVVDAAGFENTKLLSMELVRPGGVTVWLGLGSDSMQLSSYRVTLPEITVMGTYSASRRDVQMALDIMSSRTIDLESWTTAFPLEDGVTAFNRMLRAGNEDIKGILTM